MIDYLCGTPPWLWLVVGVGIPTAVFIYLVAYRNKDHVELFGKLIGNGSAAGYVLLATIILIQSGFILSWQLCAN